MPRKLWDFLFPTITICFYILEELTLSDSRDFGTRGEWFAVVFGIYVLIIGAVYWLITRAAKGTVTATGLVREKGPTIPLACVERIVSAGGRFPAVVLANDDQVKMHLDNREYIKLAKSRLNQWTIKGRELTVEPGKAGQELKISYATLGRYDTYRTASLSTFVMVVFVMALLLKMKFDWDTDLVLNVCLIYGVFFMILPIYRGVNVSVEGDKVLLKSGKKEESFRLSDVVGIKKGLFQIKVTVKDGEVFFIPRGCIFFPEIVEEYAGLIKR